MSSLGQDRRCETVGLIDVGSGILRLLDLPHSSKFGLARDLPKLHFVNWKNDLHPSLLRRLLPDTTANDASRGNYKEEEMLERTL